MWRGGALNKEPNWQGHYRIYNFYRSVQTYFLVTTVSLSVIKYTTRMHSSRMHTAHSLTVSRRILCMPPGKNHACPPGKNHACPPAKTMHAPPGKNHACLPWSNHAPPPKQPRMPPPGTTMHAPPGSNHARPPLLTESQTPVKI